MSDGVPAETSGSISTPDRVESRLGTLEFRDGAPTRATADLLYDHLDFVHGVEGAQGGRYLIVGPGYDRPLRRSQLSVWPVRSRTGQTPACGACYSSAPRLFQLARTSFPSRPCVSLPGPEEKISSFVLAAFPLPKRKLHRPSMAIGRPLGPRS